MVKRDKNKCWKVKIKFGSRDSRPPPISRFFIMKNDPQSTGSGSVSSSDHLILVSGQVWICKLIGYSPWHSRRKVATRPFVHITMHPPPP